VHGELAGARFRRTHHLQQLRRPARIEKDAIGGRTLDLIAADAATGTADAATGTADAARRLGTGERWWFQWQKPAPGQDEE